LVRGVCGKEVLLDNFGGIGADLGGFGGVWLGFLGHF